jgi:uncharacterized protein (TIGR02246 family)
MALNVEAVDAWLARYIAAWKSYDPAQIAALFADDCQHRYTPFDAPQIGKQAIVDSWLANRDAPDTYDARYETLMIDGDRAVTHGRTWYYAPGTAPGMAAGTAAGTRDVTAEFANIWVLCFNDRGECCAFTEWYFERGDAAE